MPIVAIVWLVALGVAVEMPLLDAMILWMMCEDELASRLCRVVFAQWLAMGIMASILLAVLASPAS
jgi:capsid protein